jgi:hypothetical protein
MKTLEYRVRPVTRYIVTEYHSEMIGDKEAAGSRSLGEFDSLWQANEVAGVYAEKSGVAPAPFVPDHTVYRSVAELIEALSKLPPEAIPFVPEPPFTGVRIVAQKGSGGLMFAPPERDIEDHFKEAELPRLKALGEE